MASKKDIRLIRSLRQKKYRKSTGLFCVEGEKNVKDYLDAGFQPVYLWALPSLDMHQYGQAEVVSEKIMSQVTAFKTPSPVLAVFRIPESRGEIPVEGCIVVLDGIRDPGNLGTIIRMADWYGVSAVVCSPDTTDMYNPKVIQSAMGSTARMHVEYTDIGSFLQKTSLPVYLTTLQGDNLYQTPLPEKMVLVMGNESEGIRDEILRLNARQIRIPGGENSAIDSLNVSIATAIVLSEWYRLR